MAETSVQMFKRRAAEYRQEAERTPEPGLREAFLKVADSYDELAERFEKHD
jgi:hypothetical protein